MSVNATNAALLKANADIASVESSIASVESSIASVESNISTLVVGDGISNVVALTQAEYDALTPDASTLYVITD